MKRITLRLVAQSQILVAIGVSLFPFIQQTDLRETSVLQESAVHLLLLATPCNRIAKKDDQRFVYIPVGFANICVQSE